MAGFAFRVDASLAIGSGHVMRCLTLADELASRGQRCVFIMRERSGDQRRLVVSRGHDVVMLPDTGAYSDTVGMDTSLSHSSWLGTGWRTDAQQTIDAITKYALKYLVVDHYGLDYRWETVVSPYAERLMVIDDLADRRHDCDVLLDQNLGRAANDYDALLPPRTSRLIGAGYALLRPEFMKARKKSLAARHNRKPQSLLVSMGGVDQDNVSADVLRIIDGVPELANWSVTVILGGACPHKDSIARLAGTMDLPVQVIVNTDKMSELMTEADVAVGAAGGAAWERCCLGLPTLLVVMAPNQHSGTQALEREGAAVSLGAPSELDHTLASSLRLLIRPQELARVSEVAARVCDGNGTARVVDVLMEARV